MRAHTSTSSKLHFPKSLTSAAGDAMLTEGSLMLQRVPQREKETGARGLAQYNGGFVRTPTPSAKSHVELLMQQLGFVICDEYNIILYEVHYINTIYISPPIGSHGRSEHPDESASCLSAALSLAAL